MAKMRILTPRGPKTVEPRNEREASLIGGYWNAVRRYLHTGETFDLFGYAGAVAGDEAFEIDPEGVEFWATRGELDFEDIYEITEGGR